MKKTLRPVLTAAAAFIMLCALVIGTLASGAQNVSDDPADSYVKQTAANEDSSISLWFEHSFKKVFTSDKTPSGMNTYSVYMAKNEIESAQFVLYSDTDKTGMKAEVSSFTDNAGNSMSCEIYYEMYVTTDSLDTTSVQGSTASTTFIRAGETPDPVAPMKRIKTFKLNGGKSQAFLIRITSTADTPSGWYSAQLDIKNSAGEVVKTATVYAYVWDFTLSEKTSLQTAFYLDNNTSYGGSYKTYYNYLLSNRINAMDIPGTVNSSNEYLTNDRVTAIRVNTTGGGNNKIYMDPTTSYSSYAAMYDELKNSDIWDSVKDKFYFYTVDEPMSLEQQIAIAGGKTPGKTVEDVKETYSLLNKYWPNGASVVPYHENHPYPYFTYHQSLDTIASANKKDATQEMLDTGTVKIWCPQIYAFTPQTEIAASGNKIRTLSGTISGLYATGALSSDGTYSGGYGGGYYNWEKLYGDFDSRFKSYMQIEGDKGNEYRMWTYSAGWNKSYSYCNHLIENTGLQTKMLFWQLYQNDVTGYLYYGTNNWNEYDASNGSFTDTTVTGALTNLKWKTNRHNYAATGYSIFGNGTLFYGLTQAKIMGTSYIGSLRVELMRDGIEEYQMLKMLEELKGKDTAKAVVAKVSKNVVNYLSMPAFKTAGWDSSMDEYDIMASVRRELGSAVEEATLAGQCEHKWDAGVEVKAAGCITTGEKKFTCTLCGAERTEIIPTLHSVGNTFSIVSGSPATCTTDSTQVMRCSVCGYEKTEYAKAFHSDESHWQYESKSSTLHTVKCDTCGTQLEVSAHTMLTKYTNTCTEDGEKQSVCRYCGYTEVIEAAAAKGHNYADGVCTRCGAKEAGSTYTVTIGGTAVEYAAGETVKISAETFYTANHLYYRFTGWSGDTDVLGDATQAEASFTMPEKDIVLEKEYLVIGDVNGDGSVNAIDLNLMRRAMVGLYHKTAGMDINKDDNLNSIDLNLFRRMLVGLYAPAK